MPIANIGSVLARGILSYERAAKLEHHSVALQPVQDKRDQKQVPGGLKLHRYANLYFHARNPMMFKRKDEGPDLCVLQVSTQVLDLNGYGSLRSECSQRLCSIPASSAVEAARLRCYLCNGLAASERSSGVLAPPSKEVR
jgi:ssDNA thymidine ADP-ribosyltransferase, DarT